MGYVICRECGARIDLPRVTHALQLPPFFKVKCSRCGRSKVYSYVDLKDVRFPTEEEYLRLPGTQLRLLVDLMMYMYGVKMIQETIVYALRKTLKLQGVR